MDKEKWNKAIEIAAACMMAILAANLLPECYMGRIAREYHRDNDVQALLDGLEQVLDGMKKEDMPKSWEEFEARAVLFYILKQLEEFLKLKNEFVHIHRKK